MAIPKYGSRLMPMVVDDLASKQPDLAYALVPLTANISDGFKKVTFADIAKATDEVAAWIDTTFGRSTTFETLAYMGLSDLRYVVVFLAAVKCGYKLLLPSLRNSPWMNTSLLEQTNCTRLLFAHEIADTITPLQENQPGLSVYPILPLDYLIEQNAPHYAYSRVYEEAKWDPVLVLHSSGSTGAPRPIVSNHATYAVGDNDRNLAPVSGRKNQNWALWNVPEEEYYLSPFPAFHLAGFSSMVMVPIYYQKATLILCPPTRPPTGQMIREIMNHIEIKSIFCPPIIVEQLIHESGGLEKLGSMRFVLYAGGPLSNAAGEALTKVTHVCQFYGSTEAGPLQTLYPAREDWAYLEWHPKQEAIMDPSVDGAYELIMRRNPKLEGIRCISCNFPDVEEWRTKDLFTPHPSKPGLWKFHGRADDIIVLSNGEKFNPVPAELSIGSHPLLTGALVVGDGYPQASLIVEPRDHAQGPAKLIEDIWPTVEKANADAQGHAQIMKDMIIIGSSDKVFERSPKGTIVRRTSVAKYEELVAQLYNQDTSTSTAQILLDDPKSLSSITTFVTQIIEIAFPSHTFKPTDDLFVLGLDSLQTTTITSKLKSGIASSTKSHSWIIPKLIYTNPSIESLSTAIHAHLSPSSDPTSPAAQQSREQKLDEILSKHLATINTTPSSSPQSTETPPSKHHILLTGTTGSLGTHLLSTLLSNPATSHITLLNRSPHAESHFLATQPPPTHPSILQKTTFHTADFSTPTLGLSPSTLETLKQDITVILHNAFPVSFTQPVSTFSSTILPSIPGLINLASSSPQRPRIVFISSISSVLGWKDVDTIPETPLPTPTTAQPTGYAEAKAISEILLTHENSPVDVSVLRVGQIAPPVSVVGAKWNEKENIPLLLRTSKTLNLLPFLPSSDVNSYAPLKDVDWIPMDVLADTITDIIITATPAKSENPSRDKVEVFNIVNPQTIPWIDVLPTLQGYLGNAKVVELGEWIEAVEGYVMERKGKEEDVPAIKILDFFRDMVPAGSDTIDGEVVTRGSGGGRLKISTAKAVEISPRLGELGPIRLEWVEQWVNDLGYEKSG